MMLSLWTHHIRDPEEKIAFEKKLHRSSIVYNERLRQILADMLVSLEGQEVNTKTYDNPNWQYRMADMLGSKRILKKLLQLTDFDQKETTYERPSSTTGQQPGIVSVPL